MLLISLSNSDFTLRWRQSLSMQRSHLFPSHSATSHQGDTPAMTGFHCYYDHVVCMTLWHKPAGSIPRVCWAKRRDTMHVVTPENATHLCQTMTLLWAVVSGIETDESPRPLTEVYQTLEKSPGLRVVTEEMRADLGKSVSDVCGNNCWACQMQIECIYYVRWVERELVNQINVAQWMCYIAACLKFINFVTFAMDMQQLSWSHNEINVMFHNFGLKSSPYCINI